MHRASHSQHEHGHHKDPARSGSPHTSIQSMAISEGDDARTQVLAVLLNNGQVVWWQFIPDHGIIAFPFSYSYCSSMILFFLEYRSLGTPGYHHGRFSYHFY